MTKIVFYLSSLSPPKRRNVSEKDVLLGKKYFMNLNVLHATHLNMLPQRMQSMIFKISINLALH